MRKGKMSNSCRSMKVWRSESCTGWHSVVFAKRFLGDGVVDSPFPPFVCLVPGDLYSYALGRPFFWKIFLLGRNERLIRKRLCLSNFSPLFFITTFIIWRRPLSIETEEWPRHSLGLDQRYLFLIFYIHFSYLMTDGGRRWGWNNVLLFRFRDGKKKNGKGRSRLEKRNMAR